MTATKIDDVLVLVHAGRPGAVRASNEIVGWLRERCSSVRVELDLPKFCGARRDASKANLPVCIPPELLVVLGGDGSILGAAQAFREQPVPTVGVNFGHVGFLASTPADRWEETLTSVLAGEGRIEQRMRLAVEWSSAVAGERTSMRSIALNEVVLQRSTGQAMIRASMRVGKDHVTTYRADGLILATPSGSTAYSLSAGGPILQPSLDGLVVTPICSQALSNRPLVLNTKEEVCVVVTNPDGPTALVIDGNESFELADGEEVRVSRHPVAYPLIAMPDLDPFRRLRERLGWSGGPFLSTSES